MVNNDCTAVYDPPPEKQVSKLAKPRARQGMRRILALFFGMALGALLICGSSAGGVWFFFIRDYPCSITGNITINFYSREKKNAGEQQNDVYKVNLDVRTARSKRTNYSGTIIRKTRSKAKKDSADDNTSLVFDVTIKEIPSNLFGRDVASDVIVLGRIIGSVPIEKGKYLFENKLKWTPSTGVAAEPFRGFVQGKEGKKQAKKLHLRLDGEEVPLSFAESEPMIFHSLTIPGHEGIREATLSGDLTFNYGNESYYTDNLCFEYADKPKDLIQGSILWYKDPTRYLDPRAFVGQAVTGARSQYLLTLIFNADADAKKDNAPLFEVENPISKLKGIIDYDDDGYVARDDDQKKEGELVIGAQKGPTSAPKRGPPGFRGTLFGPSS